MANGIVKLTVNVPAESVGGLRDYAKEHGITMTEGLRRALGLQSYLDKELAKGVKVLFEHNGKMRQLVL